MTTAPTIPTNWRPTAATEASERRFIAAAGHGIEVHVLLDLIDCADRFAVVVASTESGAEDCIIQASDWQVVLDHAEALA